MEQEEVVHIKVFDHYNGDVLFDGKVPTDVAPHELTYLGSFQERSGTGMFIKATNEHVKTFKGLQNNIELITGSTSEMSFSGVLYVSSADDGGVVRTSAK